MGRSSISILLRSEPFGPVGGTRAIWWSGALLFTGRLTAAGMNGSFMAFLRALPFLVSLAFFLPVVFSWMFWVGGLASARQIT